MRPTMSHRSIGAVRADALFVSALQPSQNPGAGLVRHAVEAAMCQFGALGCAGRVAQEFGEHPEAATARMRWARQAVAAAYGGPMSWQPGTGRAGPPPADRAA